MLNTKFFCAIVFITAAFAVNAAAEPATPKQAVDYIMTGRAYQTSAIIQPKIEADLGDKKPFLPGPEFFKRQKEEVLSEDNIVEAILELIPDDVENQEAFFDQVRNGIEAEFIRGTDLMRITVTSGDKRFSRDLANQLAERLRKKNQDKNGGEGATMHKEAELGKLVEKKEQKVKKDSGKKPDTRREPK